VRQPELNRQDRLKGTLIVLAWLALALILRDWNGPRELAAQNEPSSAATALPAPDRSP
jgi:hypothetical protein